MLASSRGNFGDYTGFYHPVGGHVEEGETDDKALIREIQEELSLKAQPIRRIMNTPSDVPDEIIYWWECTVSGEMKIDKELSDARYFTAQQLKTAKLWPTTRKVFEEHIL